MTPRITISDDLAKQLEVIKEGNWKLRGRGMEDVIAHVVDAYSTNNAIDVVLEAHLKKTYMLLQGEVSKGVEDALKKWILNILSFGKP